MVASRGNRLKQERGFMIRVLDHPRVNKERAGSFGKSGPRQPQRPWKLEEVGLLPRGQFMCPKPHAGLVRLRSTAPDLCVSKLKIPNSRKSPIHSLIHLFVGLLAQYIFGEASLPPAVW